MLIMESKAFKTLLTELDKLTPQQRKQIEKQLQRHDDIQSVITLIEKRIDTTLIVNENLV
ncbi:hypothetical protein [Nitrosomonas sp. Nm51]|uniref:hypothetical protein n=1 Tax=Nitrosomonas sp. Nm51 TaxID=133720 RepID=UPI000B81B898|nr:hypothetical protein [Nitrosomonas sp. Nm51]